MPPRKPKPKNLLILLVDVGVNITDFDKVKTCAFNIYKGKLFKEKSLDEIGLLVIGSEESENPSNYEHICVASAPGLAAWSILKAIHNLEQNKQTSGDWLQGLAVACDLLEQYSEGQSYAKVGFILISNFESSVDASLLPGVQKTLCQHAVDLICIGLSESNDSLVTQYPPSYQCLSQLATMPNVELSSVNQSIEETKFTPREVKNSMPWNVDFYIGDLPVPITGYKWVGKEYGNIWSKIKQESEVKEEASTSASVTKPQYVVASKVYTQKSDPTQPPLEEHEVVRGYYYGNTIIPMTSAEKAAMKYQSGERGLKLICFTTKSNVPLYLLQGDTVYIITASTKSKDNTLLLSLIKQLHSEGLVAIVRHVYSKNSTPNIQVLYPVMEEAEESEDQDDDATKHKYYFAMADLPFAQQMTDISSASDVANFSHYFDKTHDEGFSQETQDAMETYIERLDLVKEAQYAEDIPYLPEVSRNPSIQIQCHLQVEKCLSPHADLAKRELPSYIRQLYEPRPIVHHVAGELKQALGEIRPTSADVKDEDI
ncbi:hypothetical protein M8J76_015333 [Diaphorina citri]|nr:hypothetical protein M8J76_015333 [Diaphorina citri]